MSMHLAIIGAGGHGKVAADIAELTGWDVIHFYDDAPSTDYPWQICGNINALWQKLAHYQGVFVALGNNAQRKNLLVTCMAKGVPISTLIHPSANLSRYTQVGAGSLVEAGAIIRPATTLGLGVIVNYGACIGHDCLIGDYCHIAPGALLAGQVTLGEESWVGIGSIIIEGLHIGAKVMLGAGALVVKDLQQPGLYYGSPAILQRKL